jgi:hypothetical protein
LSRWVVSGPSSLTQMAKVELSGGSGEQRDKHYCGKGKDTYFAEKIDYVESSCEKKELGGSA